MKAYAIFKPVGGHENFCTLIFQKKKQYFTQEENDIGKNSFVPCEFEDNEVIYISEDKIFEDDETRYVYSFISKDGDVVIGFWWELIEYLLKISEKSNDLQLKYRIGKELRLRGMSDKIKIEREKEFNAGKHRITFQNDDDYFVIRELRKPYENLLESEIEFFNYHFITKDLNIVWDDVISTKIGSDRNSLIIDNFSFDLDTAFDHIIKNNEYQYLSKSILKNTNAPISYIVENSESIESKGVDLEKLKSIGNQVKALNNE